jgi:hypothetical protein
MTNVSNADLGSPAEQLNTLTNLVELALYAPQDEITFEGRIALQRAARSIVVLARDILAGNKSDTLEITRSGE